MNLSTVLSSRDISMAIIRGKENLRMLFISGKSKSDFRFFRTYGRKIRKTKAGAMNFARKTYSKPRLR
jgi:hypothetical protein